MKETYQRAKQSIDKGTGLVGAAKYAIDEAFDTKDYRTRQEENYWFHRNIKLKIQEERRQAAKKLPKTIAERYSGRVALVTNFGAAPGVSGPSQIGLNIAQSLIDRGFGEADSLIVDAFFQEDKINRMREFDRSRKFVAEGFAKLMPQLGHISSNDSFHGRYTLPTDELAEKIQWHADFRDEREPEARLGYVCVVSALELGSIGQNVGYDESGTRGDDYQSIRYGGALMFNLDSDNWEQVIPGNQFDRLPEDMQQQSYVEARESSQY